MSDAAGGEGVEYKRPGIAYEEAVTLSRSKREPQRQHRLTVKNFGVDVRFRSWFKSLL